MSTEKMNAALEKLTKQATSLNDGDPCKVMISEYLMDKITNERIADIILDESKTLSELNKNLWDLARERKSGNGAFISDDELKQIADEYFGLNIQARANVIDLTDLLL